MMGKVVRARIQRTNYFAQVCHSQLLGWRVARFRGRPACRSPSRLRGFRSSGLRQLGAHRMAAGGKKRRKNGISPHAVTTWLDRRRDNHAMDGVRVLFSSCSRDDGFDGAALEKMYGLARASRFLQWSLGTRSKAFRAPPAGRLWASPHCLDSAGVPGWRAQRPYPKGKDRGSMLGGYEVELPSFGWGQPHVCLP